MSGVESDGHDEVWMMMYYTGASTPVTCEMGESWRKLQFADTDRRHRQTKPGSPCFGP